MAAQEDSEPQGGCSLLSGHRCEGHAVPLVLSTGPLSHPALPRARVLWASATGSGKDMGLTLSSQTKGNGFSLLEKVKFSFLKMKRKDEGYKSEPAKSGTNSPEGQKWKRRGKTCVCHATAACASRLVWTRSSSSLPRHPD